MTRQLKCLECSLLKFILQRRPFFKIYSYPQPIQCQSEGFFISCIGYRNTKILNHLFLIFSYETILFFRAIQTFEYYIYGSRSLFMSKQFWLGNYKLQMSQVYYQISHFINLIDPAANCPPTQELFEFINTLKEAIENNPQKAVINYESLLNIYQKMLSEPYFKLENYAEFYEIILDTFSIQTGKVNYQHIEIILKLGVLTFSKITLETQESWSHPANYHSEQEQFFEEDYQQKICQEIMANIDCFAQKVGYNQLRAAFLPIFRSFIENSTDWRYRFGSIIIASQIGSETQNLADVNIYVEVAIKEVRANEPKVRLAALELLGVYSDELTPIFQQAYYDSIVPAISQLLSTQTLPRIIAHGLSVFSNFLSKIHEFWKIETIFNNIISQLSLYLKSSSQYLKGSALDFISNFGQIRNCFGRNLQFIIQACGEIIHEYSQNQRQNEILQQSFQALSLLLAHQDRKVVSKYVPTLIQYLLMHKEKISESSFVLCWGNLCSDLQPFVQLSEGLIKSLINACEKVIEQGTEQSALGCLEGISTTFSCFKEQIRPFSQLFFAFGKTIFEDIDAFYKIRSKSIQVIIDLLLYSYTQQEKKEQQFLTTAASIFHYLIKQGDLALQPQSDINILIGVLGGIFRLIQPLSCTLNTNTLLNLSDRLILYKQKLSEVFSSVFIECDHNNNDDDQFSDIQTKDQIVDDTLEQILDLISQIYGKLLRVTNHNEKQLIIKILLPQIGCSVDKNVDDQIRFGLSLAIAIAENCAFNEVDHQIWFNIQSLFSSYPYSTNPTLRNLGIYGIGIIITKMPFNMISMEIVNNWLFMLRKSLQTPFDEKSEKSRINYCKDNIIAALGKLLFTCGNAYPQLLTPAIYSEWVSFLPLTSDIQQSNTQQDYLLDILTSNPNVLLQNPQDLTNICQIFAKFMIIRNQDKKNNALSRTRDYFNNLRMQQTFIRSSQYLQSFLSQNQKEALNQLTQYRG